MPKPLDECDFYTHLAPDEKRFIGRCKEWADLKTKPHRSKLDAIDDIISQVRDQLRRVHATMPPPRSPDG